MLDAVHRKLPQRNEPAHAGDLAFEAALVAAGDRDVDDLPFVHVFPVADVDRGGRPRQLVEPFVGVEPRDDQLELCALDRRRLELSQRHDALAAARQIDEHVVAVNLGHAAGDARLGREFRRRRAGRRRVHQIVERQFAERRQVLGFELRRELVADVRRRVVLLLLSSAARAFTGITGLGCGGSRGDRVSRCEPI